MISSYIVQKRALEDQTYGYSYQHLSSFSNHDNIYNIYTLTTESYISNILA